MVTTTAKWQSILAIVIVRIPFCNSETKRGLRIEPKASWSAKSIGSKRHQLKREKKKEYVIDVNATCSCHCLPLLSIRVYLLFHSSAPIQPRSYFAVVSRPTCLAMQDDLAIKHAGWMFSVWGKMTHSTQRTSSFEFLLTNSAAVI